MVIKLRNQKTRGTLKSTVGRAVRLLFVTVLLAGPAFAHVEVDAPNGGEVCESGSIYRIEWHATVDHGPADYDVWYSTTGSDGPWIDITANVPRGFGFHDWTVPNTPSDQVRVRVRQDNSDSGDYEDISDQDLSIVAAATADSVVLDAMHDATLYEGDGDLANGSGRYLFTGRTESQNGAAERRALLSFDIASVIPAGSTITEVSLELTMSRTIAGAESVDLRRVFESWSEGPSAASGQEGGGASAESGDTTWVHRVFPNMEWSTDGGSFSDSASATLQIAGNGDYTYTSTAQMVADVQDWLDDPSDNHGWALVMPSPATGSAKRFNSRENSDSSSRPMLSVTYEAAQSMPSAGFTFSPVSPRAGETVSFTDQSTGSPDTWLWDFGDGGTSNDQNPTHVFDSSGTFTVSLTASNSVGGDATTQEITVLEADEPELTELVFIPAAANATGSGGSFFVTTLDVHNAGSTTSSFRFLWLPRRTDNSEPQRSALFTLQPGEARRFDNFLADVFDLTEEAGAAAVLSDTGDLVVMSRTFNQTMSDGTFGQSLPGVAERDLIQAGTRALVLFLTENDDFRSNLGLINGVDSPITIEWELFAKDGTSLGTGSRRLQALGNLQINRVLEDFAPIEAAYAHVWTMTTGGAFTCYGSVLDEISSDPTTVLPELPAP